MKDIKTIQTTRPPKFEICSSTLSFINYLPEMYIIFSSNTMREIIIEVLTF